MIKEKKTFLELIDTFLGAFLKMVLIVFFLIMLTQLLEVQAQGKRIREKETEASPASTNYFIMDRSDYTLTKKLTLGSLQSYVLNGFTIDGLGGVNTAGSADGKILKYLNGVLVVADDATGGTGGGAVVVSDLTDVNTAGGVDNNFLRLNAGVWQPYTATLEGIRQIGNTLTGPVFLDETTIEALLVLNDELKIPNSAAEGKFLRSNATGYASWEYPFYLGDGEGFRVINGGTPYQKLGEFAPWTISTQSSPLAANIKFPIDYSSDAKLLTFQQVSQLMLTEQTYMEIDPEISIYMWIDAASAATIDHCSVAVTLWNGLGDQISIPVGTQANFTLTGTNCTPYFDDIDNNVYSFCAHQITSTVADTPSVTATHTPSGISKTWQIEWVYTGPSGGGGIDTQNIEDDAITSALIDDRTITGDDISDNTLNEDHLNSAVQLQLVKTVTSWPALGADEGIYWKLGEGQRYYYGDAGHGCSWKYETSDGTEVCVTP